MKRGRHDGAYDQVRRAAGYTRPQPEFPDEREEAASRARVAAKNAEFQKRMADLSAIEAQKAAERDARLAERSKEISRRLILRGYQKAGVRPPGDYLVSLDLLKKIGWQVGEFDGEKVLVKPDQGTRRKTREDYEAERAQNAEGS